MKNKELTGKEKQKLAEDTFLKILESFHFVGDTISDFLYTIRTREEEAFSIMEKIDGGVDKYGVFSYTKRDLNKAVDRAQRMAILGVPCMIAAFLLHQGTKVNGLKLSAQRVKSDAAKESREAMQLCFLQLIAMDRQINENHFTEYRAVVKILRNTLEVGRMELHLNNLPTYTPAIKQADLFIWILEERLRIWDSKVK